MVFAVPLFLVRGLPMWTVPGYVLSLSVEESKSLYQVLFPQASLSILRYLTYINARRSENHIGKLVSLERHVYKNEFPCSLQCRFVRGKRIQSRTLESVWFFCTAAAGAEFTHPITRRRSSAVKTCIVSSVLIPKAFHLHPRGPH